MLWVIFLSHNKKFKKNKEPLLAVDFQCRSKKEPDSVWTEVTVAKSLVFRLEIVENLKILAEAHENNGLRITLRKRIQLLSLR